MSKIIVLVLLIAGLAVGVFLVGRQTGFFSKADISTEPQEIKVSNISDNGFTVSWITAKPTVGFVQFGESESLGDTTDDDRDARPRLTHHVTLKNLSPQTIYFYKINPGSNIAQQTTAPVTQNPPAVPEPIFGKALKADGSMPAEALVYLQLPGGSLLSSYTRDQGNWLITLNNARTKDLADYITVSDEDVVSVLVSGEGKAEVQGKVSDKDAFSQITLGHTGDLNGDGVINVFDYILSFTKK
ncbi:fibronectin type III domain-containing protein [Candidatus Daviesbacteria bacterium]|nr:fibronectin type III domain-containing protein [Candidatus Daviesbacteria bacterium]